MRFGIPLSVTFSCLACAGQVSAATIEGWASLPADTLMPGPPSGQLIEAEAGIELPFDGQPVQGFSGVIDNGDGSYLVLSDNGYGNRLNSADFLLRIYCIEPDFNTIDGGSGTVSVLGFINLTDPQAKNQYQSLARGKLPLGLDSDFMPHESVAADQLLTGADFDPESLQQAPDGTLWIGDEAGPFLLHFSADGELLERPYTLPLLRSTSRPRLSTGIVAGPAPITNWISDRATLRRSKGFEGMAMAPSGQWLYPMLEGALDDQPGQLNIYTFDLEEGRFLNATAFVPSYRYRLDPDGTAIGSFRLFSETGGLVLERDSGQAGEAKHKKVYRISFDNVDNGGFLVKEEIADLMNIADPHDLNGDGLATYDFPFHTPENLLVVDRNTLGIINDNNYPFGRGRGPDAGPEDTEFILISVADLW